MSALRENSRGDILDQTTRRRFNGKVAVITGASSGIGAEISRRLSEEGAKVSLFARRGNLLREILEAIRNKGSEGIYYAGDVTDTQAVERCVKQTVERFGTIDVLVNNAGVEMVLPLTMTSEERWKYMFDVNLGGAIRFIQNVQPIMTRSKKGVIVNMSSVTALVGTKGISVYSATKGGLITLTRSLAVELASRGIRVNAIAPGIVETELTRRSFANLSDEQIQQIKMAYPLGFGSAKDVASSVAYVASDEACWMTGSVLTIDGGYSAR